MGRVYTVYLYQYSLGYGSQASVVLRLRMLDITVSGRSLWGMQQKSSKKMADPDRG